MTLTSRRHVIGYSWEESQLVLLTRHLDNPKNLLKVNVEDEIKVRRLDHQICTGWADFDKMVLMPCNKQNSVQGSKTQCWECRETEGFYQCMTCNGYNCPRLKPSVERYCRQTHHLYLVCFGNDFVKVGTASQPRKKARLLEQGPIVAAYIASGSGPNIKQLEKTVSNLGYTERVTRREKFECLASRMTVEESKCLITDAYNDIISRSGSRFNHLFHQLEFISFDHLYNRPSIYMKPKLIDLNVTDTVVGKVLAKRGNFVVVDKGGVIEALDLVQLRSWVVEFNPDIKNIAPQQFGFFDKL